jgi:hypothetical protein
MELFSFRDHLDEEQQLIFRRLFGLLLQIARWEGIQYLWENSSEHPPVLRFQLWDNRTIRFYYQRDVPSDLTSPGPQALRLDLGLDKSAKWQDVCDLTAELEELKPLIYLAIA